MKIPKWLVALPLLALVLSAAVYDIQSNGAPMGNTNAPGELTCNHSGCHTGQPLDGGPALLTVNLGNAQGYVPGAVYPVTIEVAENGKERFGFQMLALQADDTTNAGTFIVTDSARTRSLTGINQFAGRSYMTYKYLGTAAVSPGVGRWSFEWRAPVGTQSPVTFYTAAAVANNDGTDQGEFIYTKVVTLAALPTAAEAGAEPATQSTVFPNPSTGIVHVSYPASGHGLTTLHLLNVATHQTMQLLARKDLPGTQMFTIDLRGQVSAGNYLLWISQGGHAEYHSLILLP